jgi:hypothetical protein
MADVSPNLIDGEGDWGREEYWVNEVKCFHLISGVIRVILSKTPGIHLPNLS